jgi:ketosteroid isomerase-like protein
MSQENVEATRRGVAAFNRGDVEEAVALIHPDAEFIPMRAPVQGAYRGHEGVREFFHDNAENFEVFEVTSEEIRDVGDRVVALGTVRIRGKGSGAEVTVPSAVVITYEEGKVVRFEEFGDQSRALEAAGLSE